MENNLYRVKTIKTTTGRAKISKVLEFDSIGNFVKYISTSPVNSVFYGYALHSEMNSEGTWYGGVSYTEALDLLKSGWDSGSKLLTTKLSGVKTHDEIEKQYKNILDVCGFQPIVPMYLNGAPNCMVRRTLKPIKNKVITINRSLSASSSVSSEKIMNESVKVFQIIYKLEKSGYRVNLNLVISTGIFAVKIRLKSANERLNVSKLAFPMIHTAMFRRLFLRCIEVCEYTTNFHLFGYGKVPDEYELKEICTLNKEIHIPTLLYGVRESEVQCLSAEDIISRLR